MHLELRTPDNTLFDGEVVAVTLPGTEGFFQVLNNHAPLLSTLRVGVVRCQIDKHKTQQFSTGKGIAEVRSNHLRVLVEYAKSKKP